MNDNFEWNSNEGKTLSLSSSLPFSVTNGSVQNKLNEFQPKAMIFCVEKVYKLHSINYNSFKSHPCRLCVVFYEYIEFKCELILLGC